MTHGFRHLSFEVWHMNKRVWLFSLLIALCVFCMQTTDAKAEDKAPQESVGLAELAQGAVADGNLGSRAL